LQQHIIQNCGIILLSAGSSSRLGKPKQLLNYRGGSLLGNTVNVVAMADAKPLVVVLGYNAALLIPEIDKAKALIVINENYATGMASSIVTGLKYLIEKDPLTDGVLILMCDQPFVSAALLNNLIYTQQQTGKPIIASTYGDTTGTPALFHKTIFNELLLLRGDTGARKIIQQHIHEVATVPFEKGSIDIDTEEDYENLLKRLNKNR
jgi:molybdenum cofactor cytidylyltransferase